MDKTEIQNKAEELKNILTKYKRELSQLETELFITISKYQKAVDEERIKELKESLERHE